MAGSLNMEFEKRGVPTVSLTAETFVRDAHRSAETFGFPELPICIVPLPFTNQPQETIDKTTGWQHPASRRWLN